MSLNGIQNLETNDPFADDDLGKAAGAGTEDLIHVRLQQRNGRKTLTTVQGLKEDFDKKKILSYWKKQFNTNGTVVDHSTHGLVIQMQGDQRENIRKSLINDGFAKADKIKVHGF